MSATPPSRSLTRQTLVRVAIRIAIVVAIATIISHFHVSYSLQTQALEQLEEYIQQRGVRESNLFLLAADNLRTFAQDYAKRLGEGGDRDPKARFDELFVKHEDGSTRLRDRFFDSHDITGVIGKRVDIDADLRRRLMIAFEMLTRYGPAWQNRFVNLYAITPENAVLMFWPDKPWGLNANSWEVSAKLALTAPGDDGVLIIDDDRPLERTSTWSDLYFDYAVNDWLLSATEPVNLDGSYRLSVGHDMPLRQLIERTINNRLEGTYNLIFRDDGRLIAHPRFMDAIQAQSGDLSIQEAGDANLLRIFNLVKQRHGSLIIDNSEDEEYLAVAQLQGPGWYLVTVFPKAIIAARAFKTANLILFLGAIALLLEIAILFVVLRKQVAEPLTDLMEATNRVAAGDFNIQLDEGRQDEIGKLARSINIMSGEINAREAALNERSAKLSQLNQQLEQELKERERAEREIARQREALHQSEKLNALGSLLAGVAHELNNPLSVVVGRALMLEEQLRDSPKAASIAKIRVAAERCAKIVKTFLAMARQQMPARVPVQIENVIRAALDLVGYGLQADGVEVTLELSRNLPELLADPNQLTQVFTNLLINSQQALVESPGPKRIIVNARYDQVARSIRISVSDTGPGIPRENLSRLFEPFFTTKAVGKGTGIGLSVSRGIVEAHGGTITVDVPPQGGAVFEIMLPVNPPVDRAQPEWLRAAGAGAVGCRILVVDDEPEVAQLLSDILATADCRIEIAETGKVALERLTEAEFDLVLSDLRMPGLDGPGLFREIKVRHPDLAKRVIFVTGDTLSGAAEQFLAAEEQPVIEKPFSPDEVRRVVSRVLERAHS